MRRIVLCCAVALAGCVTFAPNPEAKACRSGCTERRNACMVAATTAEAVARCDADRDGCMNPCLGMPEYLRK